MSSSTARSHQQTAFRLNGVRYSLHLADCLVWMDQQSADSVHAIVTDPPYGLKEYTAPEKQKLRRLYGILEDQFRSYFEKAARMKGVTGENLLVMLEQRLDNTVYRLGLASSRAEARQLVRHGHIEVSGHKVNIPSFTVTPGHEIAVREKSRKLVPVARSLDLSGGRSVPAWLQLDREGLKARVISLPKREDVNFPIQEQMIVELYSK